jgi:HPt (histidine-containing phosphotransfer) domain-containing protein
MATTPPAMAEALARLWTRFLPEIENRLGLLESAVRSLEAGLLSGEEREAGHQAAHKLAGVLGTFGLHRGTDLARQAEVVLAGDAPASTGDLTAWVAELRSLIESRK